MILNNIGDFKMISRLTMTSLYPQFIFIAEILMFKRKNILFLAESISEVSISLIMIRSDDNIVFVMAAESKQCNRRQKYKRSTKRTKYIIPTMSENIIIKSL